MGILNPSHIDAEYLNRREAEMAEDGPGMQALRQIESAQAEATKGQPEDTSGRDFSRFLLFMLTGKGSGGAGPTLKLDPNSAGQTQDTAPQPAAEPGSSSLGGKPEYTGTVDPELQKLSETGGFTGYLMEKLFPYSPVLDLIGRESKTNPIVAKVERDFAAMKAGKQPEPMNDEQRQEFINFLSGFVFPAQALGEKTAAAAAGESFLSALKRVKADAAKGTALGNIADKGASTAARGLKQEAAAQSAKPQFAGKLNLDKITDDESARKLMRAVAKKIEPEMPGVGSGAVVPQAETAAKAAQSLADDFGTTVETILNRAEGDALGAKDLYASRLLLNEASTELMHILDAELASGRSAESIRAFSDMFRKFSLLQAQATGASSEAGRALNILKRSASSQPGAVNKKAMAGIVEAAGGEGNIEAIMDGMRLLRETGRSPVKIAVDAAKVFERTKGQAASDVFSELLYSSLLSNPVTHSANTLSNALTAVWQIPERAVAAGVSRVPLLGSGEIHPREAVAQLYGAIQGLNDGFRIVGSGIADIAANRPLRTNYVKGVNSVIDQGSDLAKFIKNESGKVAYIPPAISGKTFGLEEGGAAAKTADFLGEFLRGPTKALQFEDDFFKAVNYRMELNARAYRQAASEGLTGKDFSARVAEITNNPPDDLKLGAMKAAAYATFTDALTGKVGRSLQQVSNSHPIMRAIVPFVRTPLNVLGYGLERTPLAPLVPGWRADLMAGGARRDLAIAKTVLGTAVGATIASLTVSGNITGGMVRNPKQRALMRDTGWQPYSVKVGDKYYSYGRIEPIASVIGLAADATEIMARMDDPEDRKHIASIAAMAIAKNASDKTFVTGVSRFIAALSDPERYGENYWEQISGMVAPAGVAQFTRSTDPIIRETHGYLDGIKARIPGLSETLPPALNMWGEEQTREGALGLDMVSPIYVSTEKSAEASRELLRLGLYLGKPNRTQTFQKVPIELDDAEYNQFVRLSGNEIKDPSTGLGFKDTVTALANGSHPNQAQYDRLSDGPEGGKAMMIRHYRQLFLDAAKNRLLQESPKLNEDVQTGHFSLQIR